VQGSVQFIHVEETDEAKVQNEEVLRYITSLLSVDQGKCPGFFTVQFYTKCAALNDLCSCEI